jgi:hypothetical protein
MYRVTIDASNPTLARIEATVPAPDKKLWMAEWGADMLSNGWASNVRDLIVQQGKATLLEKEAKWNIEAAGDRVHITYAVDLSFAGSKWPSGNEQAGVFQEGALFVVSKALFIVSDAVTDARIDLHLPQTWKASTPWKHAGARSFVAESRETISSTTRSWLVATAHVHVEHERKVAKFWLEPVRLARSGDFSRAEIREIERLVEAKREKFLEAWNEFFGQ